MTWFILIAFAFGTFSLLGAISSLIRIRQTLQLSSQPRVNKAASVTHKVTP